MVAERCNLPSKTNAPPLLHHWESSGSINALDQSLLTRVSDLLESQRKIEDSVLNRLVHPPCGQDTTYRW